MANVPSDTLPTSPTFFHNRASGLLSGQFSLIVK